MGVDSAKVSARPSHTADFASQPYRETS